MQINKSINEWHSWIELVLARLPQKGRYQRFYAHLDNSIPDWQERLKSNSFLDWALYLDTSDGCFMLSRLYALWSDPAYSSSAFSALLRLYERPNPKAPLFQRLFGKISNNTLAKGLQTIPVLLERYELLKVLGRGGNGEVYLAWSRETETVYALKLIRWEMTNDPIVRQTFRDEIETWIRMGDHPNVAKAYFLDDKSGQLMVAMDLVEGDESGGPSLADKLESCVPSVQQISTWFAQIADGLQHAYLNGVKAHRDIKPGNILITSEGVAKVSDFGLAITSRQDALASACVAGTPQYMSPEQFIDVESCDQRSDIYSLGVTLYQALNHGKLPFAPRQEPLGAQQYLIELRNLHVSAKPKRLNTIFWPIIERCLAKDPSDRFASIAEFRLELTRTAKQNGCLIPEKPLAKNEIWTLRDQGNTLMRLGKNEDAIKAFDSFLAIMPDSSAALNRACCLENLGRYREAFEVYEKFARQDETIALNNGANCLLKLGDLVAAETYIRRAIEIEPEDSALWISLGNICYKREEWRDALRAYTRSHALSPDDPTPPFNISLAALELDDIPNTVSALRAFLALAASDDNRREWSERKLYALTSAQ